MWNVFRHPFYAVTGLLVALFVLVVNAILSSITLWSTILSDKMISAAEKMTLLGTIIIDQYTTSGVATNVYVAATAIGIGINVPLLIFYFRNYRPGIPLSGLPVSVLGVLSGIFGVGCLACGSIFFTAFFASAAGFLSLLPFGGTEIGFAGLCLIYVSSFLLVKDTRRRT